MNVNACVKVYIGCLGEFFHRYLHICEVFFCRIFVWLPQLCMSVNRFSVNLKACCGISAFPISSRFLLDVI